MCAASRSAIVLNSAMSLAVCRAYQVAMKPSMPMPLWAFGWAFDGPARSFVACIMAISVQTNRLDSCRVHATRLFVGGVLAADGCVPEAGGLSARFRFEPRAMFQHRLEPLFPQVIGSTPNWLYN